jgi:hypothetical protein
MTKTRTVVRFATIAACFAFVRAEAHHSYGMFDRCTATTLDGKINSVDWVNPHIGWTWKQDRRIPESCSPG